MKVIFLDMDGVVNSDILINEWIANKRQEIKELNNYDGSKDWDKIRIAVKNAFNKEFDHSTELIFPELAGYIKQICDKTDCFIVWSSTWRNLSKYQDIEVAKDMFNRHGLPGDKLIGYTPQLHFMDQGIRGNQIRAWINNNTIGKVTKAAVIDDRFDAGENLPKCAKYFNINPQTGINEFDVEDIINYLNKED
jgi:hypothetical protein